MHHAGLVGQDHLAAAPHDHHIVARIRCLDRRLHQGDALLLIELDDADLGRAGGVPRTFGNLSHNPLARPEQAGEEAARPVMILGEVDRFFTRQADFHSHLLQQVLVQQPVSQKVTDLLRDLVPAAPVLAGNGNDSHRICPLTPR